MMSMPVSEASCLRSAIISAAEAASKPLVGSSVPETHRKLLSKKTAMWARFTQRGPGAKVDSTKRKALTLTIRRLRPSKVWAVPLDERQVVVTKVWFAVVSSNGKDTRGSTGEGGRRGTNEDVGFPCRLR